MEGLAWLSRRQLDGGVDRVPLPDSAVEAVAAARPGAGPEVGAQRDLVIAFGRIHHEGKV